jgi:predicted transcriptional regulator
LQQFAASKGKDAAQVVEETVARMLERQAQFIEGVNRGIPAADRGDLVDHDEVVNRIKRLFSRDADSLDDSSRRPVLRL